MLLLLLMRQSVNFLEKRQQKTRISIGYRLITLRVAHTKDLLLIFLYGYWLDIKGLANRQFSLLLYEAMERMLTDEPMRKSMAGKARKMIADRFEKNFVQGCQIAFYEEIL